MAANESSSAGFMGKICNCGYTSTEHYQELIMNFMSMLEVDKQDFWFQQNGGYSVYSKKKKEMLLMFFGYHIIFQSVEKQPAHVRRIRA
jgi:hypothetical protein